MLPLPSSPQVLYAYIDLQKWSEMDVDTALRAFLSGFRLPGEAQIIDRMLVSSGFVILLLLFFSILFFFSHFQTRRCSCHLLFLLTLIPPAGKIR